MSKSKKVLLGIGLSLVAVLGIAYVVLYLLYPENTQTITWQVIDYICNKPLPVIGVSTLFVLIFAWKVFGATSFGKKSIKSLTNSFVRLKQDNSQALDELKAFMEQVNEQLKAKDERISQLEDYIKKICDAIPNKKVKAIGEQINGEETNSDTETEKI